MTSKMFKKSVNFTQLM